MNSIAEETFNAENWEERTKQVAQHQETKSQNELNRISQAVIGAAIAVHRALGLGLLESAYEACLEYELLQAGLRCKRQEPLAVVYREIKLDCGYRLDLLVEDSVVIELKAVDKVLPIHKAQLTSYLKLSGYKLGLIINFNVKLLKEGITRIVNDF